MNSDLTPDQPAHEPDADNSALSGSDAVNAAAQRAKTTAAKNIPGLGFEEMPLHDDTANLREGPSLHDGLLALLPLVGVWHGTGQANYDGEEFAFGQQLVVSHDGENYLRFESRLWRVDPEGEPAGPLEREVGFWRISDSDEIEVTLTNARGLVEILYGEPVNERAWSLSSASTIATATGPASHGPGKRLYGLMPNQNLGWVDERMVPADEGEAPVMVPYMSAELTRVAG